MGSSDCFCAICGGCIRAFEVGSKSEKGQRVREKVLRNRHRKRRDALAHSATRSRSPDENISEPDDSSDMFDPEHSWVNSNAYDPRILEGHDTDWITELVLVANDMRKREAPRSFFCGLALYVDNGMCEGGNTTDAKRRHGLDSLEWYDFDKLPLYDCDTLFNGRESGLGTFPCHVPCLKILAKAINGGTDFMRLDPYVLQRTMHSLSGSDSLRVDYGDVEGREQFWDSYPGEEFTVVDPLESITVNGATICDFITTDGRRSVERSLATRTTRVKQDLFCKLPTELIHHMASYMGGHELLALRQASRSVRQATRSSDFWKRHLLREQAWLWDTPFSMDFWQPTGTRAEGASVIQHDDLIDWEKLCVVLENSTARGFGSKGWLIALANCRRIWKVCEGLAKVYWDEFWPQRESLWEADRLAERAAIPEDLKGCYTPSLQDHSP